MKFIQSANEADDADGFPPKKADSCGPRCTEKETSTARKWPDGLLDLCHGPYGPHGCHVRDRWPGGGIDAGTTKPQKLWRPKNLSQLLLLDQRAPQEQVGETQCLGRSSLMGSFKRIRKQSHVLTISEVSSPIFLTCKIWK